MGREIRRVPVGYEHPKDERTGHYVPLYDRTWEDAMNEWLQEYGDWKADKDGERTRVTEKYGAKSFAEWHGDPPSYETYRMPFPPDVALGFCMYETVSEGTPVSPIFATTDELVKWLIGEGYSEDGARKFAETGWSPSFVMTGGQIKNGIDALGDL